MCVCVCVKYVCAAYVFTFVWFVRGVYVFLRVLYGVWYACMYVLCVFLWCVYDVWGLVCVYMCALFMCAVCVCVCVCCVCM